MVDPTEESPSNRKMSDSYTPDNIPSEQSLHREYVDSRFKQLSQLESSSSDSVYHYLFNINAGASVAVLTFIGTSAEIAELKSSHLALGAFVLGVLMCGVFRAFHIHWASNLFATWQRNYDTYNRGHMEWDRVTEEDATISNAPRALWISGYAAAACFVLGCLFALTILNELKNKDVVSPKGCAVIEAVTTKVP